MFAEDTYIDLSGVECPMNFIRSKLLIDTMKKGQILKIKLDNGEAVDSVISSLIEEGHDILETSPFDSYSEVFVKKSTL